jgi:2-hydroxy-3-oxopropionate reductase
MTTPALGFIGLGRMGKPMARNLARAGYRLTVANRSAAACEDLAAEGAAVATSAGEVAAASDVVFTMLPDGPDVAAVLLGREGAFARARPGTIFVDASTISPLVARELAVEAETAGIAFLDAPVSGGPEGAATGSLSIMIGGDEAAFTRVRPVLDVLGTTVVRCGPSGAGQVVKACNQLVVALHIEAAAEAIALARKAGVAPETMLRVLGGGLAASRVMDLRGASMAAGDFTTRGRAAFHRKDLGIALELARAHDAVLPLTALVDQLYGALVATGRGDLDHTALAALVGELSGG